MRLALFKKVYCKNCEFMPSDTECETCNAFNKYTSISKKHHRYIMNGDGGCYLYKEKKK